MELAVGITCHKKGENHKKMCYDRHCQEGRCWLLYNLNYLEITQEVFGDMILSEALGINHRLSLMQRNLKGKIGGKRKLRSWKLRNMDMMTELFIRNLVKQLWKQYRIRRGREVRLRDEVVEAEAERTEKLYE